MEKSKAIPIPTTEVTFRTDEIGYTVKRIPTALLEAPCLTEDFYKRCYRTECEKNAALRQALSEMLETEKRAMELMFECVDNGTTEKNRHLQDWLDARADRARDDLEALITL